MSLVPLNAGDFAGLVEVTQRTLSASTARVYTQTYRAWEHWVTQYGLSPLDLNPNNVVLFLSDQPVTRGTRQRMLSALRSLAEMLAILDPSPAHEVAYKALKRVKSPTDNLAGIERPKRALNPDEALSILSVWGQRTNQHTRNRALIAVLLTTGLRRSEAAVLQWTDIDLDEGVIRVRHGKGDKEREVAVYGDSALEALEDWKRVLGDRTYVFCAINRGDRLGPDQALSDTSVYRVVKQTELMAGVGHFSPHDARRTLITELLANGTPLADAQAQAGHSQGQTTLRYAQATDARRRRKQSRLRYR